MTLIMPDTSLAVQKIQGFESYRAKPYLDTRKPPVATIGYGTTVYPNGKQVKLTDSPCTPPQAIGWLTYWVKSCAFHLWPAMEVQPTLHQWSAILSLAYNEGWFAIYHSTLIRYFNDSITNLAADEFLKWDKIHHDGQLVDSPGLLNRREAERALFKTPDDVKV